MQKFTCAIGFLALVLILQDLWVPAEGVRVKVIKVKKDKRQAQRGYTDVPLDEGPFDDLASSSPASTSDFSDRGDSPTNLNDPESTNVDYSNGYPSSSSSVSSIDSGSSSIRVEQVEEREHLKTASASIDEQKEENCDGGCNGAAIPGDAGLDYPNYAKIPQTSFSCKDQNWPGYYADTEARCQVFWICQKNRMDAFLCPNGTLFNQQVFVCDWWFNVDCSTAPEFYTRNQFIYAGPGVGIDGKPLPSRRTNGESSSNKIITTVARPSGTNSNPLVDRTHHLKNVKVTSVHNNIYQESASVNSPITTQRTTAKTTVRTTPKPTTRPTTRRPPPPPVPARKNTGSKSALKESGSRQKEVLKVSQSQKLTSSSKLLASSANNDDTFSRPSTKYGPPQEQSTTVSNKLISEPATTVTNKYGPPQEQATTSVTSKYGPPEREREFTERPAKLVSSTTTSSKYSEPEFTPPLPPREPSAATIKTKYGPPPPQGSAATLTQKYGPPDFNSQQSTSLSSEYGAPGFVPGNPQNFVDESRQSNTYISSTAQPNSFNSLNRNSLVGFSGQRSNQFNNVNGQRENMYASSLKNSVVEFPLSPSQQKNKLRQLELANRKDTHMDYQHFGHGQRSNAFSDSTGPSSISYVSSNNKQTFIDHSAYSGKKNNVFSTPVSTTQKVVFAPAPTSTTQRYIPLSTTVRPHIISSAATPTSAYTVPDGYAALHAGSYISIATSPSPPAFSKKILLSAANSKSFQTVAPRQIAITSTPRTYFTTITPTAASHRQSTVFSSVGAPTVNPYFTTTFTPSAVSAGPRYVTSNNNNYIVSLAPTTQSYPATTSAGHRQNTFTGHGGRRHNSFSSNGFSNTINFPGGISDTNVRFGLGGPSTIGSTKRNIVDFSYTASPISSTTTPYPSSNDRFSQVVSTTLRPQPSKQNSIGTTVRYAGAVTNKSTSNSNIIYVDPADSASSHQAPVSTSAGFGQRISGSARKRMTGAWQNYFNDN